MFAPTTTVIALFKLLINKQKHVSDSQRRVLILQGSSDTRLAFREPRVCQRDILVQLEPEALGSGRRLRVHRQPSNR